MATFSSIEHVGGPTWKFTPSGTAPFDYYYRGKLVVSQSLASYILYSHPDNTDYEPPALEVIDVNDTDLPESTSYPGYVIVQWEQVDTADYYTVERYESSTWVAKARKLETGLGYYKHISETVADDSSEQWRVTAYDKDGNSSGAQTMTFTMRSHPEPPAIAITYSVGPTPRLIVSEAS